MSNPKLAERLSLSVTPCWRRLKRLEEAGYIKDYQANLDRRKLGYDVLAFVRLSFGEHADDAPNRFEDQMRERPEVLSCHKITGDADYRCKSSRPIWTRIATSSKPCCAARRACTPSIPAWRCAKSRPAAGSPSKGRTRP
ncbi:Lrp/AsnC family transcriptional regulator [Chromobacterium haemolyticum]|uniref:Lrp/AsnC family transcriptional regulator n=1 Tax=Chromobacterium haemolyticum TaxID=394935 RepID=UPI00267D6323